MVLASLECFENAKIVPLIVGGMALISRWRACSPGIRLRGGTRKLSAPAPA
jgi:hypothetical protein